MNAHPQCPPNCSGNLSCFCYIRPSLLSKDLTPRGRTGGRSWELKRELLGSHFLFQGELMNPRSPKGDFCRVGQSQQSL